MSTGVTGIASISLSGHWFHLANTHLVSDKRHGTVLLILSCMSAPAGIGSSNGHHQGTRVGASGTSEVGFEAPGPPGRRRNRAAKRPV